MEIDPEDLAALQEAKRVLDSPSLAVQLTNIAGKPIESVMKKLPKSASKQIVETTQDALQKVLKAAVLTMGDQGGGRLSKYLHKAAATLSGAVGGAFGLPALALELPISTGIMLRSIADIARSEGEDIHQIETQLACLEVFALGGTCESDDASETGYYATRAVLGGAVSQAAQFIAQKGITEEGAPAIVRLITKIAARFSVPVSEKFAAQSLPVIGAAGGGAINLIFINHYQDMARAHFTVRRLERKYGADEVKSNFLALTKE